MRHFLGTFRRPVPALTVSRSPVPALPFFFSFTQKHFPRMRIRHNLLSFSSLFLYPGADYTVPLAFLFYHVYGNPNLSVLGSIIYYPCMCAFCVPSASLRTVCSVCLLCAPYDLGIWFVPCVFAVRSVVCVGLALHHSATQSRTCSAFFSFHTDTLSPNAYTIQLPLLFAPFLVPRG